MCAGPESLREGLRLRRVAREAKFHTIIRHSRCAGYLAEREERAER